LNVGVPPRFTAKAGACLQPLDLKGAARSLLSSRAGAYNKGIPMRRLAVCLFALVAGLTGSARAEVFAFTTDPFAGSDAPVTPGRQIVGGEPFITFSVATDVFAFLPSVFGVGNEVQFASGPVAGLPTGGVNVIVLQTFDNDADPLTPFGAGMAANLIAAQITTPGAGFFIYFNSGLDVPRLVFSTDLSDPTADLKILARMTNFAGQPGALATFGPGNFAMLVAEPSGLALIGLALVVAGLARRRRDLTTIARSPGALA
jgi:hypothetical protein